MSLRAGWPEGRLYFLSMTLNNIVAEIDAEIARLQKAKALLSGDGLRKPRAGFTSPQAVATGTPTKRRLSPEARARIADAQKKRWAAQRAKTK